MPEVYIDKPLFADAFQDFGQTAESFPGVFRILNTERKKVFFGEGIFDTWIEMQEAFNAMEDNIFQGYQELYRDYKDRNYYGRDKFKYVV